ncbi:choice-of-anchor I family protein [Saccharospirillum mangrovi]|uniref:choice-of-anchor I family protein n=1 Tax=Saccharospirillum mangrovi TaxID=2161747 RepID=UPI000D3BC6BD|nr:choice-of-anchor I family protein [Saccharospirillum mangrovi]
MSPVSHRLAATLLATAVIGSVSAESNLTIDVLGRHTSGIFAESAAEIVSFHPTSGYAYMTNGATGQITAINLNTLPTTAAADPIRLDNLHARAGRLPTSVRVATPGGGVRTVAIGGANSLAVKNDLLAIAVEHDDKTQDGAVLFYRLNANGDTQFVKGVLAGALPDMVTFSPDGRFALAANEGEPRGDYLRDPEGSVTVIPITNGTPADLGIQLNFTAFDRRHPADILSGNNPRPNVIRFSQDLEPEYISVSEDSRTAFVSLQENNAVARISLDGTPRVTALLPLGFKDHGLAKNALDADKDDEAAVLMPQPGLWGVYQPDSIASYRVGGVDYFVTANEGDAREYFSDAASEAECQGTLPNALYDYDEDDGCLVFLDETEIGDVDLDPSIAHLNAIKDLKILAGRGDTDGDGDYDKVYAYGTRSFSIYTADGRQVYDSGDLLERVSAEAYPEFFNTDEDALEIDNRSDNKGPEPEALALGRVGDRTLAFVGLERMGGFIVADVTDPMNVEYLDYINNRNFNVAEATDDGDVTEATLANAGDLAPEGMAFVPADISPIGEALLIVANEVSGTTTVYRIRD